MKEVIAEHPEYKDIEVQTVNEFTIESCILIWLLSGASYYIDDVKVHEGIASKQIIEKVFESAYKSS